MRKSIVIIGGGSACAGFIQEGLDNYKDKFNLTVIGSMVDDGGSTGKLKRGLGVSALGSLRKCFLALSEGDKDFKRAFAFRFTEGELKGHVAGNIFMAAIEKVCGSIGKSIEITSRILKIKGKIIPSTFDKTTLFAELENGQIIRGESNIDIPRHDGGLKIKKIFLKPYPKGNPEAVKEISVADIIVIGPGDFYTTVLPNFLIKEIKNAIKKAKAKKVFIVNIVTKFGETNDFSVSDLTNEIEKYMGSSLDFVIYNSKVFPKGKIKQYKRNNNGVLGFVKIDKNLPKDKFIGQDILLKSNPIFYNHKKLAKIIITLF